jgi:hypothetical protein
MSRKDPITDGCDFDFLLKKVVMHFNDAMTHSDSDLKPSDDDVRCSNRTAVDQDGTICTISPSPLPNPTSSLYFMTAANTCVLIALWDDCFAFSNCHVKV